MKLQLSQAFLSEGIQEGCSIQQDLISSQDTLELEGQLADYVGAERCISVESATSGLLFALKAAGIGSGDPVLCTTFSYFATAEIIRLAGGVPMFVDINPNSFSIDPFCLEYVIGRCIRSKQPIPKALIAVDLFGLPCNYDNLEEICERHSIILIEDMAESFGAAYHGRRTGSFGRMAVASFFPARSLSVLGEGGAVFCHNAQDAQRLQSLRRKVRLQGERGILCSGGSHLDTVQASLVSEKLQIFDQELEYRRMVAKRYRERLTGSVKMQIIGEGYDSAYTQFVLSLPNAAARENMIEGLQQHHIPCCAYNPAPVLLQHSRQNWDRVALVNTQSVAQRLATLPIHPYLSNRIVDYICDHILELVTRQSTPEDIEQAKEIQLA